LCRRADGRGRYLAPAPDPIARLRPATLAVGSAPAESESPCLPERLGFPAIVAKGSRAASGVKGKLAPLVAFGDP